MEIVSGFRLTDKELADLIILYKPFDGSIAERLLMALIELQERREAENDKQRND